MKTCTVDGCNLPRATKSCSRCRKHRRQYDRWSYCIKRVQHLNWMHKNKKCECFKQLKCEIERDRAIEKLVELLRTCDLGVNFSPKTYSVEEWHKFITRAATRILEKFTDKTKRLLQKELLTKKGQA